MSYCYFCFITTTILFFLFYLGYVRYLGKLARYLTWQHHRLTALLYFYMRACKCQLFTDEGSRRLPKRRNYCFSVLASATNRSIWVFLATQVYIELKAENNSSKPECRHFVAYIYLLYVAMATSKRWKGWTVTYIVYNMASWLINWPGALGFYLQPIALLHYDNCTLEFVVLPV